MRTRKRPLITDDTEEENETFINNSDLEREEVKDANVPVKDNVDLDDGPSDSEYLSPVLSNDESNVMTPDRSTSIPNNSSNHALENGASEDVQPRTVASKTARSDGPPTLTNSPTATSSSTSPNSFVNSSGERSSQNIGTAGLLGVPSLSNIPPEKLSFLHQQSDIQLQSPTKRREMQQQSSERAADEPRLVIQKLVLTNFKSYAGVQVIGPFNASFSAVVGPNGSGKSNVIDSMLFVFGFRASKMRQGKLSELIHNSEGGQKQIGFCQVDIHFHHVLDREEEDKIISDKVPDSELVISRKAYRNNSSQYYINGKTSNYTEVTDFLKKKGIDLDHKRFLILQGEVESIAQMKAKAERENDDGLLEYLEDIIGTTKYKSLIEQNLSKIDELNDICLEKETRFELVEKDKESLEDKKVEALKFLEMEKKLIQKKSIQFQSSLVENKNLLQKSQDSLSELQEQLSKEKLANQELNKEIDVYHGQHLEVKELLSKLSQKEGQFIKNQKVITKVTVSLEEKSKNLASKSKKVLKTIQNSESIISSSTFKLDQNSTETSQYKQDISDLVGNLETEKQKLDEIRKALTVKTSGFSKKIEELQEKLEPWNDKVKDKEGEISLISSSIQMLNSQREAIEKQLQVARERLVKIKDEGRQKEIDFQETTEKLEVTTKKISSKEEVINHQRIELSKRKEYLMNLRQRTQDSVSSLNQDQNRNKVLTSLMRLAKSGRIDGFYGRLGDLGYIDDKYDVAISTAGGGGLDSMVVETVETAQSCIDYLRKNKLGYANFICLNKLRKFDLSPISTPGNPSTVKRLFDLIQPTNDKFKPAFYSKLYNTLVASNLQEAKQVAYGARRWKVVTMDGKVVDTSGTMSGGGNYVSKGSMKLASKKSKDSMNGSLISEDDVMQLRNELSDCESKFEHLTREFQENENNLRQLKDSKPDLEFALTRIKLDIESLLAEKKEAQKICKTLIAENENDSRKAELLNEIQEKETTKEQLLSEKEKLKNQMSEFEGQIKDYEEKILDAGGVELRLQNSKVDSIKQKIEILNEKLSNERVTVRKLENEVKRHTKILGEAKDELQAAERELKENEQIQESKASEITAINEKLAEVEAEKDVKQGELDALGLKIEEKTQQINEFKSVEIEIEEKIEKRQAIVKRTIKQIEECEESLSALVVRDALPYIDWIEDEEERNKYNGEILEELTQEQIDSIDSDQTNTEIEDLEKYMENVKVDIEVLKEYGSKKTEFESRRKDLNSAVEERDNIKSYCEDLKRKRLDEFMEGFNTISMSLKEMYQMITMGGNAELELVDSLDPFSEGILFSVMPPKKSWKNISNLSGGEKTLSSLALVFALHRYKPTPLYVMDEIDAALDFRNVSIVANYIKERTKNAQFVVISLRNNMFELAQQLVGIYKVNNMTKSISLQNKDFINNT
ncbi:structural maintenance of chromosomes protein 4 [[Candida] railenensis]|uniref:Structural maintenance of chromosomes protein n=1 Tax=[Candida] railenensis TaxID=45579 RepID=A0A9P0VWU3_9ASCO|nr:structural maintenance of chromosomes protein 4 [[Candida] railenensis]